MPPRLRPSRQTDQTSEPGQASSRREFLTNAAQVAGAVAVPTVRRTRPRRRP